MDIRPSLLPIALSALLLGGCDEGRKDRVTVPLKSAREVRAALPKVAGARDPKRPLVVIDAGHGGEDPGAVSPVSGRPEKDVTLAIAKAVHAELARSGRVRVALTREADTQLQLEDRYEIARRLGARLFISIHADAAPRNKSARGASIYTLSEVASDREAALLAVRENRNQVGGADVATGSAVKHILIDLAQRESMEISAAFAKLLYREASPLVPFQPDYHRFAALIVLKAPDVPSVLFESGYLTNPEDEAFLQSPEGRQRIAQGMRRAIETHFARLTLDASR